MKYLGEKSVSSVFSVLFKVFWYLSLFVSIAGVIIGFMIILASIFEPVTLAEHLKGENIKEEHWQQFMKIPPAIKFFLFVLFWCVGDNLFENHQQVATNVYPFQKQYRF